MIQQTHTHWSRPLALMAAGLATCALLAVGWVGQTHAQGVSILANDALKALLGDQVDLPPADANDAAGSTVVMGGAVASDGSRNTYRVQRGETLDRIIRKTMPGSVLSMSVLRKAFTALNPHAFPRGTPHIILANAVLQVPTIDDLRAMANGQPMTAASDASGGYTGTDKRKWVRFP
ncbi:hypothetical protein LN050_09780 [Comamonadaceae bacterium M7527]|nr:hypothetical protein LN050_09780 [Comamonadaceae bacterium M7527]